MSDDKVLDKSEIKLARRVYKEVKEEWVCVPSSTLDVGKYALEFDTPQEALSKLHELLTLQLKHGAEAGLELWGKRLDGEQVDMPEGWPAIRWYKRGFPIQLRPHNKDCSYASPLSTWHIIYIEPSQPSGWSPSPVAKGSLPQLLRLAARDYELDLNCASVTFEDINAVMVRALAKSYLDGY